MKRLKHYVPNYILTVLLVFCVIGLSIALIVSECFLNPSFYINSAKKHNIYQYSSDYAKDYFEKSYAVSSIPAEIYMDGLDQKIIKQAVDGKINSFFDYVSGKSDKIEKAEIDFTALENSITDYFNEFAEENNVEKNDLFKEQLDKTISAAEKDVDSFTNVFMLDYMEKAKVPQKIRKVYPLVKPTVFVLAGSTVILLLLLIIVNRKDIKSLFYWVSVSGLCASVITLIPCIFLKYTDYFSRLIMRTDYIYFAVTGFLNDSVNTLLTSQIIIFAVSVIIMVLYAVISKISKNKTDDK